MALRRGGTATVDERPVVRALSVPRARSKAYQEVTEAWMHRGWPPQVREYERLRECLDDYLRASFPGKFSDGESSEIVREAMRMFIPRVHVRPIQSIECQLSLDSLLQWVDNLALDHLFPDESLGIRWKQLIEPSSIADDDALTRSLLRVDSAFVRDGMRALVAEGHLIDFLIITHYFDLGALNMARPPKPAEVVARLRKEYLPIEFLTDICVSDVLTRFRDRIYQVS